MPKTSQTNKTRAGDASTQRAIAKSCDHTVITCMDWRGSVSGYAKLVEHVAYLFDKPDIRFDHLSVPGACFYLASRGTAERREALLEDVATAISLHGIENVILVPHTGCGAYKLAKAFAGPDDELRTLRQDIAHAASCLRQKFGPTLNVLGSIAHMDDRTVTEYELVYGSTRRPR